MKISAIFSINMRLIKAFNSCDQSNQMEVIDDIMKMGESDITKVFRKRYFIWNIFRGKDFYKVMTRYVVNTVTNGDVARGVNALRYSLVTADNDQIRKAFVKAVMKGVPLITIETVMYASKERMDQLLSSNQLNDAIIGAELMPFVDRIKELTVNNEMLQDLTDMQLTVM